MIDVQNVSRAFGMLRAVDDVSLSVGEGETVGMLRGWPDRTLHGQPGHKNP